MVRRVFNQRPDYRAERSKIYAPAWKRMVRVVLNQRPKYRAPSEVHGPVCALCLPEEYEGKDTAQSGKKATPLYGPKASAEQWEDCAGLSSAVGTLLRKKGPAGLRRVLRQLGPREPGQPHGETELPKRTLCFPNWSELGPASSRASRLVSMVGEWLDRPHDDERPRKRAQKLGARLARADRRIKLWEEYVQIAQLLATARSSVEPSKLRERIEEAAKLPAPY